MDPRPLPLSDSVLNNAAKRILSDIEMLRGSEATDAQRRSILPVIAKAIVTHSDGFDRAHTLFAEGLGPCEEMVAILSKKSRHEARALHEEEAAWVMRTGVRFPAPEGAFVKAVVNGVPTTIKVVAVIRETARGVGKVIVGAEPGEIINVLAENCTAIRTENEPWHKLQVIRPTVGFDLEKV